MLVWVGLIVFVLPVPSPLSQVYIIVLVSQLNTLAVRSIDCPKQIVLSCIVLILNMLSTVTVMVAVSISKVLVS